MRQTPIVAFDPDIAVRSYKRIRDALPGIGVHYAVKCQPDPAMLSALIAVGGHFEVASAAEVDLLTGLGVPASDLVFSNPVKSIEDIRAAHGAGVRLYAFDSPSELAKIAEHAPGADVMVRMATRTAGTNVPSEGKFGVDVKTAATLLFAARQSGLTPYGISFHVGSQCLVPSAYVQAIQDAARVMDLLETHGVRVELLDVGGGFPAEYAGTPPPDIEMYGQAIRSALAQHLPYSVRVIAEPGRAIAAEAGTMISSVIGVAHRFGKDWAHLDVGAFHGLMEALETDRELYFPTADSRRDTAKRVWTLTGPSCDSQDTILHDVELSAGLDVGDLVYIGCAGAYTTCYTGAFNGFSTPELVITSEVQEAR